MSHRTPAAPAAPTAPTAPGGSGAPAAEHAPLPTRQVPAGRGRRDAGMATAEYAIATLAACGFAALLLAVLSSGEVRGMLLALVQRALSLV